MSHTATFIGVILATLGLPILRAVTGLFSYMKREGGVKNAWRANHFYFESRSTNAHA